MFSYAGKVDIGVHEEQNDDRVLIGPIILTDGKLEGKFEKDYVIASVCDGVGGLAQGYRAAMMTLEKMSHLNRPGVTVGEVADAIEVSNRRIRGTQSIENLQNGLRTTIAGVYIDPNRFLVFNAGDSRVYRFRYRYLNQLSKDHSLVQDMVDLGEISSEEAKTHPKKNVINKCIGNDEVVNPRVSDLSDDLVVGDIFLICSDGLTDEVTDAEIKEILLEHKQDEKLDLCCEELCKRAITDGSKDNISLILLRKDS